MKAPQPEKNARGPAGHFSSMIFLSLSLHLIIITVILISVPTFSRKLTFGPVYSVSLIGPEALSALNRSSALKEFMEPDFRENPGILKNEISPSSSTPILKENSGRTNIEKAIKALKQHDQNLPETEKKTTSPPVSSPTGASSSPKGISRIDEYTSLVWYRVKGNWALPPTLMPRERVEALIDVRISRNGTIEYIGFEKRSGNAVFDDSAMKAVRKSAPLPPLPESISGGSLEFIIRFPSEELRR